MRQTFTWSDRLFGAQFASPVFRDDVGNPFRQFGKRCFTWVVIDVDCVLTTQYVSTGWRNDKSAVCPDIDPRPQHVDAIRDMDAGVLEEEMRPAAATDKLPCVGQLTVAP